MQFFSKRRFRGHLPEVFPQNSAADIHNGKIIWSAILVGVQCGLTIFLSGD